MYQYPYLEQFYQENYLKLLDWSCPLRPSKSCPKNGAAGVAKFVDFYKKTQALSFTEDEVLKILSAENVSDGDTIFHQNLRVMRELKFVLYPDAGRKKYTFTEDFVDFVGSNHSVDYYMIEKLMSIASIDDLTMYFNFLICVMREAALYGQVIQYRDSADKFTLDVPDLQKRKEHQSRVYSVYGFKGDEARTVPENYTPNISYFCHAVLKQLGILTKSDVRIDNMGTLVLTPLGEIILSKINDNLQNGPQKQKRTIAIPTNLPLQQIFYGAPGTGKSHKTNEITREYNDTIRTTFHPDSDYSTFVGSYKPTTNEEFVYGLDSVGKTIQYIDPQTNKPLKTSKIEYKFIKQAFLKAYIRAWQKMCVEDASSADPLTFTNNAMYTIVGVDKDKVTYQKEHTFPKKLVESEWDKIWSNGSFLIPTGPQSGKSIQHAISLWIYNIKGSATTKDDFSAGWDKLIEQLQKEEKVEVQKSKIYELSYNDDTESVKVSSYANAGRDAIKKCYDGNNHRDSVEGITNILKSYNLPSFEEAWAQLSEDVTKGKNTNIMVNNTIEEQFLVIEEINRGNCAQIFGDIFQLLDRTDNGYSQYPIEADQDIQNALIEDSPKDGLSFGSEGLQLSDGIIEELNEIYKDSADDIVSKICHGEVLVLPKNLHIWATMNTSDQSLFPIDSAFKRRWDWKYMPIHDAGENWTIALSDVEYDWWDFVEKINNVIGNMTSSEDKKLGYFFCKACNGKINAETFVNKVVFYLWNDVFKDYELSDKAFQDGEGKLTFNKFYTPSGEANEATIKTLLENLEVKKEVNEIEQPTE